jgi:membrane-bound lytic murein transglycosylase B
MKLRKNLLAGGMALALCAPLTTAAAQSDLSFDAYLQLLAARARAEGVSEGTIASMMAGLTPNSRVIELDRAQPGSPTSSGFPSLRNYGGGRADRAHRAAIWRSRIDPDRHLGA